MSLLRGFGHISSSQSAPSSHGSKTREPLVTTFSSLRELAHSSTNPALANEYRRVLIYAIFAASNNALTFAGLTPEDNEYLEKNSQLAGKGVRDLIGQQMGGVETNGFIKVVFDCMGDTVVVEAGEEEEEEEEEEIDTSRNLLESDW